MRQIPGVTDANYSRVMNGCESLQAFAQLSEDELVELLGTREAAHRAYNFTHAHMATALQPLKERHDAVARLKDSCVGRFCCLLNWILTGRGCAERTIR